jgi:hypothetical protein
MEPKPWDLEPVKDAAEAERVVGFRPSLPRLGLLAGTPTLSVVRSVSLSTKPLKTSDIKRALAAAGVSDMTVPKEWEGITLVAEGGPIVVVDYPEAKVEVMESAPFRMTTPSGFQFGRFMEIAFRVFGRSANEARHLSEKFAANPALAMHFPERSQVREVALRSGQGVLVGDVGDHNICFFWNTPERIYIVSAENMHEDQAATLANSMQ